MISWAIWRIWATQADIGSDVRLDTPRMCKKKAALSLYPRRYKSDNQAEREKSFTDKLPWRRGRKCFEADYHRERYASRRVSYPFRKRPVQSRRTPTANTCLYLISRSQVTRPIPWDVSTDFFVSFTVSRGGHERTKRTTDDTECRPTEIGWLLERPGNSWRRKEGHPQRGNGTEEKTCVSRIACNATEIIFACRAMVSRWPLRHPIATRALHCLSSLLSALTAVPATFAP